MNKLIILALLVLGITSYVCAHRTDDYVVACCRFVVGMSLVALAAICWLASL